MARAGPRARRAGLAADPPLASAVAPAEGRRPAPDLAGAARPPGRRGADQPDAGTAPRGVSRGADRRARLAEQPRRVRGRPERVERPPGGAELVRARSRAMGAGVGRLGAGSIAAGGALRPGAG